MRFLLTLRSSDGMSFLWLAKKAREFCDSGTRSSASQDNFFVVVGASSMFRSLVYLRKGAAFYFRHITGMPFALRQTLKFSAQKPGANEMGPNCNSPGRRRVVITGLGVVSAIGIGRDAYWESLKQGRSGIKKISSFDTTSYPCDIAAAISDFDPADFMNIQQSRRIDRFAQLAIAAAKLSVDDAELDLTTANHTSVGLILGTSLGTLGYAEQQFAILMEKGLKRINPFFPTSVIPSSAATQVMLELKIKGACKTITTACASSTWSIGEAFESIKFGKSDVMLAGGAEAPITPSVVASLGAMQLLAQANGCPTLVLSAFLQGCRRLRLRRGRRHSCSRRSAACAGTRRTYLCRNRRLRFDDGCVSHHGIRA